MNGKFFCFQTTTKKINMLAMCNVKTEYKNLRCKNEKKKRNYFFVSHKDETSFIFWHAIIFLLLCGNQNILPWYNILNDVQNKNLVLRKNNFVLKQNIWRCTKSNLVSWCRQKRVVARKSVSCQQKKSLM